MSESKARLGFTLVDELLLLKVRVVNQAISEVQDEVIKLKKKDVKKLDLRTCCVDARL